MVLSFTKTLSQALEEIELAKQEIFPVHKSMVERDQNNNHLIIQRYGKAKWAIVDQLNGEYSAILNRKFDLYNWLYFQEDDEVAYFLNEVGNNSLHYSQFKAPAKFHLWKGKKGFVLGIEQFGQGFDAMYVDKNNIKQTAGAAFDFFRKCRSEIFFDDPKNAKIVFMQYKF